MFFWQDDRETPLTKAVINGDLEAVKKLSSFKDHVFAKNYLGFNALELAKYLGKDDFVKILQPPKKRLFKIQLENEKEVKIVEEEAFNDLFDIEYTPYLEFESYKFFKKVIQRCPLDFKDSAEETVQLFKKYKNEIQNGYFAPVSIKWINETLEFGVYSEKELKKSDYVGEYTGKLSSTSVFFPKHNAYCLGYPLKKGLFSRFIIDSEKRGNESRFINHSFNPNLAEFATLENGLFHCHFFAKRNISLREQLTFDYGQDYWRKRLPPLNI